MEATSIIIPEKQAQLRAMGKTIAEKVREYFKDPEHRQQYEAWYLKRYGKPYVWKRIGRKESGNVYQ